MKSALLTAEPRGVVTYSLPDAAFGGTTVLMLAVVDTETVVDVLLNLTLLFAGVASKFAPVTVTAVPDTPINGEKLVITGTPELPTTNERILEPVDVATVTLIKPVVAPLGTDTTNCVVDAEVTVAVDPLNFTVFALGVALNPVPEIVTLVPTAPWVGEKSATATVDRETVFCDDMLPAAS